MTVNEQGCALIDSKVKSKKTSELEMLHYIFIRRYIKLLNLVNVSFSHANNENKHFLLAYILNENLNPTG